MQEKYNENVRQTLLKEYLESGDSLSGFSKSHKVNYHTMKKWLQDYGLSPELSTKDIEMKESKNISELEALKLELASLRNEKSLLEKKLKRAELRSLAYETLVDLAESTYHIKIRKNSDAK